MVSNGLLLGSQNEGIKPGGGAGKRKGLWLCGSICQIEEPGNYLGVELGEMLFTTQKSKNCSTSKKTAQPLIPSQPLREQLNP